MQDKIAIAWPDVLEAFYGNQLSPRQVEVWEYFLMESKPSALELISSIKMAANETMKPEEWRVTVRDLQKWLKIYRRIKRKETNSGDRQKIVDGIVSVLKQKAESGASRSDIGESITAEQKARPWIDTKCGNEILARVFG
jgi:hypothetical protein